MKSHNIELKVENINFTNKFYYRFKQRANQTAKEHHPETKRIYNMIY